MYNYFTHERYAKTLPYTKNIQLQNSPKNNPMIFREDKRRVISDELRRLYRTRIY